METSFTISFTPDAPTVYEPPTSTPGFSLSFAVDLVGGRPIGSGTAGLSASLTIPFAPRNDWALICDRATLTGINPIGHAPLVITSASYVGSTCDYGDPESWPAYLVYLDDLESEAELHIGFPTTNLYSWFQWPAGISTFSPPISATEQRPPLRLDLEDFVDVQLPMRLAFEIPQDPLSNLPSSVMMRELTYADAPTFSGSSYNVQCTDPDIPVVLTAPELATALEPYGPGTYDLYWRIYRGAGDMIYRGACIERDIGTYTDRIVGIGGGFGIEMDTEILAARVEVAPRPLAFRLDTHEIGFDWEEDLIIREPEWGTAYTNTWKGAIDGRAVALTWSGSAAALGGRQLPFAFTSADCLGLRRRADGVLEVLFTNTAVLAYQTDTVTLRVRLYRLILRLGESAQSAGSVTITVNRYSTRVLAISPDGNTLALFSNYVMRGSETSAWRNGILYSADITEQLTGMTLVAEGAHSFNFSQAWDTTNQDTWSDLPEAPNYGQYWHFTAHMTFEWDLMMGFAWSDSAPVPVTRALRLASTWSDDYESSHRETESPELLFDACQGNSLPYLLLFEQTKTVIDENTGRQTHAVSEWMVGGEIMERQDSAIGTLGGTRTVISTRNAYCTYGSGPATTSWVGVSDTTVEVPATTNATWKGRDYRQIVRSPDGVASMDQGLVEQANTGEGWAVTAAPNQTTIANNGTAILTEPHPSPDLRGTDHWILPGVKSSGTDAEYLALVMDAVRDNVATLHTMSPHTLLWQDFDDDLLVHVQISGEPAPLTQINAARITDPEIPLSTLLLVLSPFACYLAPDPTAAVPSGDPVLPPTYGDLLTAVNAARGAASVPTLTEDSHLITAAALHAQWMSDQDVIQETGINDSTPLERARLTGYQGATIGELRALGPTVATAAELAADVVDGWLADTESSAILLDPAWSVVGGYVVPGSAGGYVWCLELGVSA